jgi:hypothetical protein
MQNTSSGTRETVAALAVGGGGAKLHGESSSGTYGAEGDRTHARDNRRIDSDADSDAEFTAFIEVCMPRRGLTL